MGGTRNFALFRRHGQFAGKAFAYYWLGESHARPVPASAVSSLALGHNELAYERKIADQAEPQPKVPVFTMWDVIEVAASLFEG